MAQSKQIHWVFSVSFSCFVHPPALNVLNCTKIPKQLHHRCFKPRHNIITATVFNKGQKCVRNTETVAAIKRSATQQLNRKLRHRRDAFGDTQWKALIIHTRNSAQEQSQGVADDTVHFSLLTNLSIFLSIYCSDNFKSEN